MKDQWKLVKNVWISKEPSAPGVWRRKEGGFVVRVRARDQTTGRRKETFRVMEQATLGEALTFQSEAQSRLRAGGTEGSCQTRRPRFGEFAAWLFEHKVATGDIRSARGRQKFADTLVHLVGGTTGQGAGLRVEAFGDMFLDAIRPVHVETWKRGMARLIEAGDYAPTTVNGWLSVLKVVMKAARRIHELPVLATEGIEAFDLAEHATYTEEEPNALLPEEVAPFLETLRALHPGHYAMVFLGLVTGLRPSSLRPIRRCGAEADVDWEHGRLLVRRSHSLGDEVMRTTKQRRRYAITLPDEVLAVLRWHVETQLATPEQRASELLFPSITGGFRAPSVLDKPLAAVAQELGLGKRITQRALRRTFNDLARTAQVGDLVTRSISGHATERMQQHYSSVSGGEQRAALRSLLQLVAPGSAAVAGGASGGAPPDRGEQTKKAG